MEKGKAVVPPLFGTMPNSWRIDLSPVKRCFCNESFSDSIFPSLLPPLPPPPIISATRARHDSLETLFETLDLPSSPPPPPRIIKRNKKRVFFFHQNRYANIIPRGIIVFLSFPERGGGEASKDNLNIDIG